MADEPDPQAQRRRPGRPPSLLAAAMIGMERALFDREPHEVVELVDRSGVDDEPVRLYLHPDIPEASLILIRPPRPLDRG